MNSTKQKTPAAAPDGARTGNTAKARAAAKKLTRRPVVAERAKASRKRTTYHHNDLRNALLDASLDLTVKRGGPDFSLRELATLLGVRHPSVYRHFPDKAALLEELAERGFDLLASYQERMMRDIPRALDRLGALSAAFLEFARNNPGFYKVMFNPEIAAASTRGNRTRAQQRALQNLIDTIEACQAEGDIVAGSPRLIAGCMVIPEQGLADLLVADRLAEITGPDIPADHVIHLVTQLSFSAFLTKPPSHIETQRLLRQYSPDAKVAKNKSRTNKRT